MDEGGWERPLLNLCDEFSEQSCGISHDCSEMILHIVDRARQAALLFAVGYSFDMLCHLGEGLFSTAFGACWYTCMRHDHFRFEGIIK